MSAPTGIDPYDIVPGASTEQNEAELAEILERASAWVNVKCGLDTLAATTDTETIETHIGRDGRIVVHPRNYPIVDVSDIQYRSHPSHDWTVIDPKNVEMFERRFVVQTHGSFGFGSDLSHRVRPFDYVTPIGRSRLSQIKLALRYTYVNGWPVTQLATDVDKGVDSIRVEDATGIVPGQRLTIYDDERTETTEVASTYDGGDEIPLKSSTKFAHEANVGVSALPANVKAATILLAVALIKQRGAASITMSGTPSVIGGTTLDPSDMKIADELLRPYKRVVVV